jgi:cytochrome c
MKQLRRVSAMALACGTLFATSNLFAMDELHKKYGCTACHQDATKLVGPAYKDVAAKYKTDKDAVKKLTEKVRKGGMGVWGQIPMPPNPTPTDAEMKTMIEAVLKTK